MASAEPLALRLETLRTRHDANAKLFRDFGLSSPTTILANQLLSEGALSRLMQPVGRLHTLEHPILAYESGRNFFRTYTMPLDAFLRRHLTSPIDLDDPRQQLVYQALGLDRSAGFLVGGLGFWAGRNASSRLHVGRLELTLAALDPGNRFVQASDARVAEYRFLSETDAALPPARNNEDLLARMSRMTETYRELVAMQLPAHAMRLAELFGNAEARCRQVPDPRRQGRCLRLAAFIDEQVAAGSAAEAR